MGKKGFTLVELMITVAIFLVLTAMVTAVFSTARAKGRDSRRIGDLVQIRNALTLYSNSNSSMYPDSGGGDINLVGSDTVSIDLKNGGFIADIYGDPLKPSYNYTYNASTDRLSFEIKFCLETDSIQGYIKGCNPNNKITP